MFSKEIYVNRRQKLKGMVKDGIILIMGNVDSPMNYPSNTYRFRQDSTFLYFTGLNLPQLALIIDINENKEILFGNDVDIDDIIWMGPQEMMSQQAAKCGIDISKPYGDIEEYIKNATKSGRKIHFIPPYRAENKISLNGLLDIPINQLKQNASIELIKGVVSLREIKEEIEIAEIEKACAIGYKMHVTSMKMCKPGIYEHEIAGMIEGIALAADGNVSFPVILSQNGETLHNHYHGNKLESGRMMITDAGAETALNYCSDFTRTFPVSGKFTPKQKAIYETVLAANNKATSLTAPNITYKSIHLEAAKVITAGLKEEGLMKGNIEDAVAAGAHTLFFPHGLGHAMGLDVHDMEDLGENYVGYDDEIVREKEFGIAYLRMGKRLKTGMVITNEPGIYFIPALIDQWKAKNHCSDFINYDKLEEYKTFGGIRIEDDILITTDGCRILGNRIPVTVAEIEETMNS